MPYRELRGERGELPPPPLRRAPVPPSGFSMRGESDATYRMPTPRALANVHWPAGAYGVGWIGAPMALRGELRLA